MVACNIFQKISDISEDEATCSLSDVNLEKEVNIHNNVISKQRTPRNSKK
jgi:hypothetical protein